MFERRAKNLGSIRQSGAFPRAQVTNESLFSIMGEEILFQTNDPALLTIAQDAFGRFPPAPTSSQRPLIIQLFVAEPEQPSPSTEQQSGIHVHSHGHLLYLSVDSKNFFVADLERGFCFGYISSQTARNKVFVRYTFIEAAAQAMLGLSRNFVAIHAACIVKNGRSLLLQGRAGLGKSTLAYASLRRGYKLLSEDVVQVKLSREDLRLWGMPWQLHLLPDSIRFFPELVEQQLHQQTNGEWKIEVAVEDYYPGAAITNAPPGIVVLLERSNSVKRPRLERLSVMHALMDFEVIWSWEIGWKEKYDERLKSLLANDVYRLYLGQTPDESLDALEELFNHKTGTGEGP